MEKFKTTQSIDIFMTAVMAMVFASTFYKLATMGWRYADYTHAYFILPISLFLIWLQRKNLVKAESGQLSGGLLFVIGILVYMFSAINGFMFLEATAFVLVMWGVFRLRFTKGSFVYLLFPLAYLIFLIPPPALAIDMVTFPLKKLAAYGSHLVLGLFNLPVELYGVILKVGEHELFIADACSGFRSIVTLLALGAVYVYFQDTSKSKKWFIFASVLPIAIIANIFRICLTGMIAYKWGSERAEGFFHDFSGMVLFFVTVLGLMGLTGLICKDKVRREM